MKPSQNVNSMAVGLVLLITGTKVEVNSNHHRSHLHSTGGFGIGATIKVCFMSSAEINHEALREIYPSLSLGCFIRKPVSIDYLVERIMSELD
jgi:hypothetical protein